MSATAETVEVVRLGDQGDGIAEAAGGPVYITGALPGEQWQIGDDGQYAQLTTASERVEPPCPHAASCGGCMAQHMSEPLYRSWKLERIKRALGRRGIEADLHQLWQAPNGSRRRVTFSVGRNGGTYEIGFQAQRSHSVTAISDCLIARPEIIARLDVLRDLLASLDPGETNSANIRVHVLAADNGCDIAITGIDPPKDARQREHLTGRAAASDILRLTVDGDIVMQRAEPVLNIAGCTVAIPPGVFLQAAKVAEIEMAEVVIKAIGRSRTVADLFCGIGTFTLPVARRAHVSAIDSDRHAIDALAKAVRHARGLKPIDARQRDLFREPLSRTELKSYDAVVFDPPRAGAGAQAAQLARSSVATIVAVSCNPATFARDLRTLLDGGYRLESVLAFDQFLYSPHVEMIGILRR